MEAYSFALTVNSSQNLDGYSFDSEFQNPTTALPLHRDNDIEFQNSGAQPSLHTAILYDTEEEVNNLLASGAPISPRNSRGNQPLHEAITKGNIPMIKHLLNYGADVNALDFDGNTPLHLVTSSKEIIELLLKKRPEVSIQNRAGNMVLHLLLPKR
jgi:uncharacterized protein